MRKGEKGLVKKKEEPLLDLFLCSSLCVVNCIHHFLPAQQQQQQQQQEYHILSNNTTTTNAGNDSTTGIVFISAGGARDDPVASVQGYFEKLWIYKLFTRWEKFSRFRDDVERVGTHRLLCGRVRVV
jgi:hypothetical protein